MAKESFRLDRKGVSEILKGQCAPVINEIAGQIADGVRSDLADKLDPDELVEVESYTTDRGAASVTIASVRGMEFQATHGVFSRAAGRLGLDFKSK